MKFRYYLGFILAFTLLLSCEPKQDEKSSIETATQKNESFEFMAEQFADIKVLRYQVPGFDQLTLKQKKYAYFLSQAGLAGRDIMYDQNYRHNLKIRRALEVVYSKFDGDKSTSDWKNFEIYLKRIWFANGIHHHYANDKFIPEFSREYLEDLMRKTHVILEEKALEVIFNKEDMKKVNLNPDTGLIKGSAVNFYGKDLTTQDVDNYYSKIEVDKNQPIEKGLNTKLVKEDGELIEKVWKSGGMYSASINKIIYWLEKAKEVSENETQAKGLGLLIEY